MKIKLKKYLIAIWFIIVIAYNLVLFLLVSNLKKELLNNSVFWILYGWMMISMAIWLVVSIVEKKTKIGNLAPNQAIIFPYLSIVFLVTTVLYFFATNITKVGLIFVPIIIITALIIVLLVLGIMHQNVVKENQPTLKEIRKVEELSSYFYNNANECENEYKKIVLELAENTKGLITSNDSNVNSIDKQLIEYATFIVRNAKNGQNNIDNNVNTFNRLLEERQR